MYLLTLKFEYFCQIITILLSSGRPTNSLRCLTVSLTFVSVGYLNLGWKLFEVKIKQYIKIKQPLEKPEGAIKIWKYRDTGKVLAQDTEQLDKQSKIPTTDN